MSRNGTFTLTIQLGNDAMSDEDDVAVALQRVSKKIRDGKDSGKVMDTNGNSVGSFSFEWEPTTRHPQHSDEP